jgi:hypothetical protein
LRRNGTQESRQEISFAETYLRQKLWKLQGHNTAEKGAQRERKGCLRGLQGVGN